MLALELQEVVVAALVAVGIFAAHGRAGVVDGAGTLVLVEEHAHRLEDVILAVAQHLVSVFHLLGEALLRRFGADVEMLGEALDVARLDLDVVVAAAIAGAFRAVALPRSGSDIVKWSC